MTAYFLGVLSGALGVLVMLGIWLTVALIRVGGDQ